MPTVSTISELRTEVETAQPGDEITAAGGRMTIEQPIAVTTPNITIAGLDLRLGDNADENLVEIGADGVVLRDFRLDGNRANQPGDRKSNGVLVTDASNVRVTRGRIAAVSRHGIRVVDTENATSRVSGDRFHVPNGPVSRVTVSGLRITNPRRDGCSIEGPQTQNIVVSDVRTTGSSDRGSVEVKDGTSDALVTNCVGVDSVYGVAIQDHGSYPTRNVRVIGNTAWDCETLVDAQTSHPPEDVLVMGNTGRELGGDGMGGPGGIHLHLIERFVVANNLVAEVDGPGIVTDDCESGQLTGNIVADVSSPGIDVADSDGISVTDNHVRGSPAPAVRCVAGPEGNELLHVHGNQLAADLKLSGGFDPYLVSDNIVAGDIAVAESAVGTVDSNLLAQ